MKHVNFYQKLEKIKADVCAEISKIREKYPVIPFHVDDEDVNNGSEYFEGRCDMSGGTFDVHIIVLNEDGFTVIKAQGSNKLMFGLHDFAGIEDMIAVYEEVLQQVNKLSGFILTFGSTIRVIHDLNEIAKEHILVKWGKVIYYIPKNGYTGVDEHYFRILEAHNAVAISETINH
jgi:hypothetical protein